MKEAAKGAQKLGKIMGDHQAQAHSDQMAFPQEVGSPRERRSKTLRGELENNYRNLMDLVRKVA